MLLLMILGLSHFLIQLFLSVVLIRASKLQLLDTITPKITNFPPVSIILTGCNEEKSIGNTLRTLLEIDYPSLEIIAINDRSTDKTGLIIDAISKENSRIVPVTIQKLPQGRLGKVHALHQGVKRAQGEWIIFTDADVNFQKDTIKKIISYGEQNTFDHITILPKFITSSLALEVMTQSFGILFLQGTALFREEISNEPVVGIGGCNVVKRGVLDKTPGFERLKMEVADDVGLAYMLKKAGAKSTLLFSNKDISLSRYASLKDMIQGLEKNLFGTVTQYSYGKLILITILSIAYVITPFALLFTPGGLRFFIFRIFLHGGTVFLVSKNLHQNFRVLFFSHIGVLMICFALLNSAYKTWINKGIIWRGTVYTIAELKKGQRVKLTYTNFFKSKQKTIVK